MDEDKIAILGWGSLVWDARGLPRQTGWQRGGPGLKIEFSRISTDRRLTLVIDPRDGELVTTRYCQSARRDLNDALCDLCAREATVMNRIGYVNAHSDDARCQADREAQPLIRAWAQELGFDFVVWTDLPSNFAEKRGVAFCVDRAIEYLRSLREDAADRARDYIRRAPEEIDTPLRRALASTEWLHA